MPTVEIDLTLECATPPSVGAGGAQGTLADKVVTRDARGRFVIPASQIKGKLRHACEQLLRAQGVPLCRAPLPERMCPQVEDDGGRPLPEIDGQPCCLLCQIFGSPGYPSRLRFHDLVVKDFELMPEETLRPMVSLNRRRRTAEAQRLFLVETAPNFNGLQFVGAEAVTGHVRDPEHFHLILAGLKMPFAWGGGASRGLGWGKLEAKARLGGEEKKLDIEEVRRLCQSSRSA